MNYEQKYKESLERAKKELDACGSQDCGAARQIFRFFPELKKSEDERIRKELIERFKLELKVAEEQDAAGCSRQKDIAMFKRGLAWLEKQGEQKSWSEEDEKMLDSIIDSIEGLCFFDSDQLNWLKSLKPHWKPSKELLKSLPKWKKAHEHKEFPLHVCVMDENMYHFLDTEVNEDEYYIELSDLKTLPKEE